MDAIAVTLEFTPNPNTLKFVVNRSFLDRGAANFTTATQANHSPLAQRLFRVPGVEALLIGTTFVTVTKSNGGNWDVLAEAIPKAIEEHFEEGLPVFDPAWKPEENANQTEIEMKIREVLDNDIRPAVAMDGGDITFGRFEDGVVYLHLQGACSSCPSSIATLKMGVEARLKDRVPDVKEVVQM